MAFAYTAKQKEALALIRDPQYREIYLYGGARSAKTFTFLSEIILRCINAPNTSHCVCRYEQVDCRKTIYEQTLDKINEKMFDGKLIGDDRRDKTRLAFKIKGSTQLRFFNGSYIAFLGVNGNANLEKILGSEWSTIFINEATEISQNSYYTLRTRLAERSALDNKMFLDANPPAKRHWLYKRYHLKLNLETGQPLKDDLDFTRLQMNPVDNQDYINPAFYKQMSSLEAPKAYRARFFLGEYADILDGAVFKEELRAVDEEGREVYVEIKPNTEVAAVLDVGQTTACWIVNIDSMHNRILLIDYIEAVGIGVADMLDRIAKKGYKLKIVVLPHDAAAASHQTGSSVEEEYRLFEKDYGYTTTILPRSKWQDNINALRKWFCKFWFNSDKTGMGMDAVRNYEFGGISAGLGEVSENKPKHNWASHGTDALKYVALWCGRDLEYMLEARQNRGDIARMKAAHERKQYEDSWRIENMMSRWNALRNREEDEYWN